MRFDQYTENILRIAQRGLLLSLTGLMALLIYSCNLFSFSNPVNTSSDYLAEGQRKYWDGDFIGAQEDFTRAIDDNRSNGEAYWWHAKAVLRATGYTSYYLVDLIVKIDTVSSMLPFMTWSADSTDVLYQAIFKINHDLTMIFYDSTYSAELNATEIAFDYGMGLAIEGLLTLRDTNCDRVIDDLDINVGAHFDNGVLEMVDEQWNQLSDIQKNTLIDKVTYLLDRCTDVTFVIVGEIGGYDVSELRSIIYKIRVGLDDLRP